MPGVVTRRALRPTLVPGVGAIAADPHPVPSERTRHQTPAGAVPRAAHEERSAPEAEAVEPVEAEAMEAEPAEARMAEPTEPRVADADMAHTGMAHTGMAETADRARRGAARNHRQREGGARRRRHYQLTQHLLLHVRMRPQTSAIAHGSFSAQTRTGTALPVATRHPRRPCALFVQFFRRGIRCNQTIPMRQT